MTYILAIYGSHHMRDSSTEHPSLKSALEPLVPWNCNRDCEAGEGIAAGISTAAVRQDRKRQSGSSQFVLLSSKLAAHPLPCPTLHFQLSYILLTTVVHSRFAKL